MPSNLIVADTIKGADAAIFLAERLSELERISVAADARLLPAQGR
jgi:hypothetical protein